MYFQHSPSIWNDFPGLVPGVLRVNDIRADTDVTDHCAGFMDKAQSRLDQGSEGGFREIQAWRSAFAAMGLKPTKYRCAAEAMLRRLRTTGSLPRVHPVIDVCNAVSAAFAIPVGVFDLDNVDDGIEVRYAVGGESYLAFSGETETPDVGEVVFADSGANAHARRWTNRQSRLSAVQPSTSSVLIVAEALHEDAVDDVRALTDAIAEAAHELWGGKSDPVMLTAASARHEF